MNAPVPPKRPFALFDVPADLCSAICSKWLLPHDLATLDNACISHSLRHAMMEVFSFEGICIESNVNFPHNKLTHFLRWLSDRKLSAKELQLRGASLPTEWAWAMDFKSILRNTSKLLLESLRSDFAMQVMSMAPHLTQLTLGVVGNIGYHLDTPPCEIPTRIVCPRLRKLNISNIHTDRLKPLHDHTPDLIDALDCVNLSALSITATSIMWTTPIILKLTHSLGRSKANLQDLILCQIKGLSDDLMVVLFQQCGVLSNLAFVRCEGLTVKTISNIGELCPNLRKLELDNSFQLDPAGSEDSVFLHLGKGCRQLQHLSVIWEQCFDDQALSAVYHHMPALETLLVSYCDMVSGQLPVHQAAGAKSKLQDVHFSRCESLVSVMNLCLVCPDLVKLHIEDCPLTEAAWAHIFTHGTKLTTIVIRRQYQLPTGLRDVPTGCLQCLRVVDFAACAIITGSVMREISRICPNLQAVHFRICTVETVVLEALGARIAELNLEGCRGVPPLSILAAVSTHPSLRKLSISAEEDAKAGTTAQFLRSLAKLPALRLEWLNICNCPRVPENVVSDFLRSCPTLKTLILQFNNVFLFTASQSERNANLAYFERLQRDNPDRRIASSPMEGP